MRLSQRLKDGLKKIDNYLEYILLMLLMTGYLGFVLYLLFVPGDYT